MRRDLDALRDRRFDLLVIGGGITGAGVALDATLRGLAVALVDKRDFASGTSSVSSKLIHGGLRYLEHGRIGLVRESLRERKRLLRNAPHLVQPLRFVVPVYRGARVPRWTLRLGLMLYDLLAGRENLRRSRTLSRKRIEVEFPALRSNALVGGAAYFDAQMDDARLCLEVIMTAAVNGACVANYVEVIAFEHKGGKIAGARVVDRVAGREFVIRARQVLNAAGPWVDALGRLAGDPDTPHLQPTKGVHLILPDQRLPAALLLLHPRDGRVFFVIPWLGRTLLGTTDTFTDEPPDKLHVTEQDRTYLLEGFNHHFQTAVVSADVINTFVGLRPLIRSRPGEPSALTREFRIFRSLSGLLSVAGGKYTTYRHMAEVIVDEVERSLGRRSRLCTTSDCKLIGAPEGEWEPFLTKTTRHLQDRFSLPASTADHLVRRYGRRAAEVAAYAEREPALVKPIILGEADLRIEILYQRDHEMALFPEDHLLRRTRLGLFHPELPHDNRLRWLETLAR